LKSFDLKRPFNSNAKGSPPPYNFYEILEGD
jgi:hypothetical protein